MSNTSPETPEKYPFPLRILHWLAVAGFTVLFVTGPIMVDLDKTDPLRADLFGLHKSFGVIAIILLIARLWVRLPGLIAGSGLKQPTMVALIVQSPYLPA